MIAPNPAADAPAAARTGRTRFDDPRRIAVTACVLLVTLRLFIGWQLAYEGAWKVETLDTPRPWTSAGYLANAQGPLRPLFRDLAGDPDDLGWLDYDTVSDRWDDYYERFVKHHPDLTDAQKARLNKLYVGEADFRAAVTEFPEGVEVPEKLRGIVKFSRENPQMQRIVVDGQRHLTADEKARLIALVDDVLRDEDGVLLEAPEMQDSENYTNWELARAYTEAIERVYQRASRLNYRERLAVALKGDPNAPKVVFGGFQGVLGDAETLPEIDTYYRSLLDEYESMVDSADTRYEREHAETLYGEIQELRKALVNPVKSLEAQLLEEMDAILTIEQKARGPFPRPWSPVRYADALTITGLCTLGTLLLIGFFTRFAAFMAGVMVLGFYLAWPPWPGVPEAAGPDHALVVNKNLIEVMALFALAALPTGRWFGVDGLIAGLWRRFRGRREARRAEDAPPAVADKPAAAPVRRDALGRETMPLSGSAPQTDGPPSPPPSPSSAKATAKT